jgi:RNA polymerase sigma-70 factor (ECF subfamily)
MCWGTRSLGLFGQPLRWYKARHQAEPGRSPFLALERPAKDLDLARRQAEKHDSAHDACHSDGRNGNELVDSQLLTHDEVIFAGEDNGPQKLLMRVEHVHAELDGATARRAALHGASSSLPPEVVIPLIKQNAAICVKRIRPLAQSVAAYDNESRNVRRGRPVTFRSRQSLGPVEDVGCMALALEAALLDQLRRQEEDAFTVIYERHRAQIYNYLFRLSGSSELADDLTHDTFLSAYESLPKLRPDSNIVPWLYRIASNRFRDFLRRKRVINWLRWPESPRSEAALACTGGEETLPEREAVQAVLAAMKPEYAICLVLRLAEGFSSEETAHILGITPEAVRMRLSRARQMFKASYEGLEVRRSV